MRQRDAAMRGAAPLEEDTRTHGADVKPNVMPHEIGLSGIRQPWKVIIRGRG